MGFAIGVERMLLLLETLDLSLPVPAYPSFFIVATGEKELLQALVIAEQLRATNPEWQVLTNTAGGGFKSQFKKADKSGADYAIIIGENELLNNEVSIKNLRNQEEQITVSQTALSQFLTDHLG